MPFKEVIKYLPKDIRQFFERCVIRKNTTEKAEIMADETINKFIERHINLPFDEFNTNFKKKKELNRYIIKIIKSWN